MRRRSGAARIATAAAAAPLLAVGYSAVTAIPADAHAFSNATTVQSAFHHNLCNGCGFNGDVAGMWQSILYTAGLMPCSGGDGIYGSGTATATRKWQHWYGITEDGIVGTQTYTTLQNHLDVFSQQPGENIWEYYNPAITGTLLYNITGTGGTWKWSDGISNGSGAISSNHGSTNFTHC